MNFKLDVIVTVIGVIVTTPGAITAIKSVDVFAQNGSSHFEQSTIQ